jgi:hypothetical protein
VALVIDLNLKKEIQEDATQVTTRMILPPPGAASDLKKPDALTPTPGVNFNLKMLIPPEWLIKTTHLKIIPVA